MDDQPPQPRRRTSILKRIAGKQKKNTLRKADSIPPERLERFARWSEWYAMGLSTTRISEREGGHYNSRQVRHGIDQYLEIVADSSSRNLRLTYHIEATNRLKAMAFDRIQKMLKSSGSKGLPIETQVTSKDEDGNVTGTQERVTFDPVDKHILPWMKYIQDLNEHVAVLQGIAGGIEAKEEIEYIDVSFDNFLTTSEGEEGFEDQRTEIRPTD